MGVPLHSLYIILIEMANVGKCIYVFCLYMGGGAMVYIFICFPMIVGVIANYGKYSNVFCLYMMVFFGVIFSHNIYMTSFHFVIH